MNGRAIATGLIWIAFAGISVSILTSPTSVVAGSPAAAFGVVLVFAIAAVISTAAMWTAGQDQPSEARLAKAKRVQRSRVDRLIEELDDDEIYELEARLLSREQDKH
jgi:hypothetical protein